MAKIPYEKQNQFCLSSLKLQLANSLLFQFFETKLSQMVLCECWKFVWSFLWNHHNIEIECFVDTALLSTLDCMHQLVQFHSHAGDSICYRYQSEQVFGCNLLRFEATLLTMPKAVEWFRAKSFLISKDCDHSTQFDKCQSS